MDRECPRDCQTKSRGPFSKEEVGEQKKSRNCDLFEQQCSNNGSNIALDKP